MTATNDSPRRVSGSSTRQRQHQFVVRCTVAERATITAAANAAGLPVGGYLRTLALGQPLPRGKRRPVLDRQALAQVLGLLGRLGGNVNQLAKAFNTDGTSPDLTEWQPVKADIMTMRDTLLQALGRPDPVGHQGR